MLKIDFLYYDKTVCERCVSTDKAVKKTLRELKKAMKDTKMKIDFKENKLPKSKTHLSPTILINGEDIEKILDKNSRPKSNICSDCCQLVGTSVNCRTFNYKGRNYDYIPQEMIMEAISVVLDRSNR